MTEHKHSEFEPAYRDDKTGGVWVHKDYSSRVGAFEADEHTYPSAETVGFRDIGSWATYINRYGIGEATAIFCTDRRLKAILDYHSADLLDDTVPIIGRRQWVANYDFPFTSLYDLWDQALIAGRLEHEKMVELLDESAPYIVASDDSDSARIRDVISTMTVTIKSRAMTEVRSDGTTAINWSKNNEIRGSRDGEARIPREISLSIPILLDGATIAFGVRLRVWVERDSVIFKIASDDFRPATDVALDALAQEAETALDVFDSPILRVV